MLSNAYFLAKFRFDTAENEPAKNLQNISKIQIFILLILLMAHLDEVREGRREVLQDREVQVPPLGVGQV